MTTAMTPWYRQPWPWFLIAVPACAVIGGAITFYLAARGWDGPVAGDYYKKGLAINAEISRATQARTLGVTARLRMAGLGAGEAVRVEIRAEQPLPPAAALQVRLIHPGRRDADRSAILARVEEAADQRAGVYAGQWQSAGEGDAAAARLERPVTWQAVLETRDWRVDDVVTAGGAGEFALRPL
jgi:hypothetical protein